MRLVDTSAWIEYLLDENRETVLARALPEPSRWLVPTIVQLELVKWLTRVLGKAEADRVIAFTDLCVVMDLTTTIALMAAEFCSQHKLSTADAIISATARSCGAELLTCDAHFKDLQDVMFIPKLVQ